MLRLFQLGTWYALTGVVALATAQATPTPSGPSEPQPTVCGELRRQLLDNGTFVLAKDVYDCAVTVPFNPAVSTRLVRYYQDALQYQANLDYLKHPPPGYQQPAVDLLAGLSSIQDQINAGGFANEYHFEASLTNLLYSANDPHLNVNFGIISAFTYGNEFGLVSLSTDGVAAPKVYLINDVFDYPGDKSWQPSPVATINGTDVTEYLTQFAALNSPGSVEPHADYNMLFESPVRDALADSYSLFGGAATFYPGDVLEITLENGTHLTTQWVAQYADVGDSGPLETGGDAYNYFVLGLPPASVNYLYTDQQSNDTYSDEDEDTDFYSDFLGDSNPLYYFSSGAFPEHADVVQNLTSQTRYVTGYLLDGTDVAALSLPTFGAANESITDFSNAVASFIAKSKSAGFKKIVIDVQQNDGGAALLAFDTYRQFFPDQEAFGGSSMRVSEFVNITGTVLNQLYLQETAAGRQLSLSVSSEWVVTERLDAEDNRPFASFADFFGPYPGSQLHHTAIQRLNLQDRDFVKSDLDFKTPPAPLVNPTAGPRPFAAEDITILSDAACSSACSIFVESMKQAGVKTVVVGGRPEAGPMQTVGGSRGARYYGLEDDLDPNIDLAQSVGGADAAKLPNRDDQSVFFFYSGLTLRNQVRKGSDIPLQMTYDAADCRIYNSFDTFYNMTALWMQASRAAANPALCAPGSTGFGSTSASGPFNPSPPRTPHAGLTYSSFGALQVSFPDGSEYDLANHGPAPDGEKPTFPLPKYSSDHGKIEERNKIDRNQVRSTVRPPRECSGKKRKRQDACTYQYYVAPNEQQAFYTGYQDGYDEGKAGESSFPGSGPVSNSYHNGYYEGYEVGQQKRSNNAARPRSVPRTSRFAPKGGRS